MGSPPDRGCSPEWRRWKQPKGEAMSSSIVCGVDGSPDAQAALEVAAGLAARLQLRLVVAHVAEPSYVAYAAPAPLGGPATRSVLMEEVESPEQNAARLVEEGRRHLRPGRRRVPRGRRRPRRAARRL